MRQARWIPLLYRPAQLIQVHWFSAPFKSLETFNWGPYQEDSDQHTPSHVGHSVGWTRMGREALTWGCQPVPSSSSSVSHSLLLPPSAPFCPLSIITPSSTSSLLLFLSPHFLLFPSSWIQSVQPSNGSQAWDCWSHPRKPTSRSLKTARLKVMFNLSGPVKGDNCKKVIVFHWHIKIKDTEYIPNLSP